MSHPSSDDPPVLGWRARVDLPELGLSNVRAKVDTGARTSALHAFDIEPTGALVAFRVDGVSPICTAPLVGRRTITRSDGRSEERWIVRTVLEAAGRRCDFELSLTDRGTMSCPLLLGREALRALGALVDPSRVEA